MHSLNVESHKEKKNYWAFRFQSKLYSITALKTSLIHPGIVLTGLILLYPAYLDLSSFFQSYAVVASENKSNTPSLSKSHRSIYHILTHIILSKENV